jgi:hypothetical protein
MPAYQTPIDADGTPSGERPILITSGDSIWIVGDRLYLVSGASAAPHDLGLCYLPSDGGKTFHPRLDYQVTQIKEHQGGWYVGTDHGLYALEGEAIVPILVENACDPGALADKPVPSADKTDLESRPISMLAQFDDHLWFKAGDYGIGRLTDARTAHGWTATNGSTDLVDVGEHELYVVTRYTDTDEMVVLSSDGPGPGEQWLPNSQTIEFRDALGRVDDESELRIAEVGEIGIDRWVIANKGIFLLVGTRAYWMADAPPMPSETIASPEDRRSPFGIIPLARAFLSNYPFDQNQAYAEWRKLLAPFVTTKPEDEGNCDQSMKCQAAVALASLAWGDFDLQSLARASKKLKEDAWRDALQTAATDWHEFDYEVTPRAPVESLPIADSESDALIAVTNLDGTEGSVRMSTLDIDSRCGQQMVARFDQVDGIYLLNESATSAHLLIPGVFRNVSVVELSDLPALSNDLIPPQSADAVDCSAFISTEQGTYIVRESRATLVSKHIANTNDVTVQIVALSGEQHFMLVTERDFFEFVNNEVRKLAYDSKAGDVAGEIVRAALSPTGEDAWIVTENAVYLFRATASQIDRVPDISLSSPDLRWIGAQPWIIDDDRVYRVYENAALDFSLENTDPSDSWRKLVSWVSGGNAFVGGIYEVRVRYVDGEGRLDARLPNSKFDYIAATTVEDFQSKVSNSRYSAEQTPFNLPIGHTTLYYKLRDDLGNTVAGTRELLGWPSAIVLPSIVIAGWALLVALTLLTAPLSRFSQLAVTNPWLRSYGSFGMIPLLLSASGGLRRHVLRRYRSELRRDPVLQAAAENYIPPGNEFQFPEFAARLASARAVMVVGRSGLGKTTFFRYLCTNYAARISADDSREKLTPVFISLGRNQAMEPIEMIASQLARLGDIHDQELVNWFLRQGGFVIFFDGLNEISAGLRAKLSSFVDSISRRNIICISSQHAYEELGWITRAPLSSLTDSEIRKILERDLSHAAVEKFFADLDGPMREIYSTPQNLIIAMEIVAAGYNLPRTIFELYSTMFRPIEKRWMDMGSATSTLLLFERAFDMLVQKTVHLESGGLKMPEPVVSDLMERKLLARSGEHFVFSHDLIRAFFASRYFAQSWESDQRIWAFPPDRNWLPMLEFCLPHFRSSEQIARLLTILLQKNILLAGEMFRKLKRDRPDLMDSAIEDSFLRRFAQGSLFTSDAAA